MNKPQTVKVVPWEEVENHYSDLVSHGWKLEPMLSLVKFVRTSGFDKRLFAYISMDRLFVTIYNPAEWNRESLFIEFNRHSNKWHFEYRPKPFERCEHETYCDEAEGINKFCRFIELLKW